MTTLLKRSIPPGARGLLAAFVVVVALGCGSGGSPLPSTGIEAPAATAETGPARAVTADIQAGIERHIEEKSSADDGYFTLPFEDKALRLKLVRVHIEYLANLGPQRNFACVDLVDTDGEVYDVDFFMDGPPGNMTVTETTVHKVNGKPLYAWEQKPDRTWHRSGPGPSATATATW